MRLQTTILLLVGFSDPAAADGLRQGAESFAGAPVALDRRLAESPCTGSYSFGWADGAGRAVEVRCAATGARLVLPIATAARAQDGAEPPRLKRGQAVQAEAIGQGFRIRAGAIADGGGGAGGSVSLKNSRSGMRFAGRLVEDGRILVSGPGDTR